MCVGLGCRLELRVIVRVAWCLVRFVFVVAWRLMLLLTVGVMCCRMAVDLVGSYW